MAKVDTNFAKIGDEAVEAKTGKRWSEWFNILDRFDIKQNGRKLAAKHLMEKHKLGAWWSQAVTIRYEWERGLRTIKNQRQVQPKHPLFGERKKKRPLR